MNKNYFLLLGSQFLGAFGDNAILAVIVGPLTFQVQAGTITASQLGNYNALYTSVLFIPYILLAPLAGYVNDRYAKTSWLARGNAIKLAGTALCLLSFWGQDYWKAIGYLVVGVGACLFSPAKYGILPEIVARERLVKANGTIEMLTLLAILSGAIGGSLLADKYRDPLTGFLVVAVIYLLALLLNLFMTPTPANREVHLKGSIDEFFRNFGDLLRSARLSRILLGTGIFWILGAVMKMNFQPWGTEILGLKQNTHVAMLSIWLSIGVMVGGMLAGQLHRVGDLSRTSLYGYVMAGFIAMLGSVEYIPFLRTIPFVSEWTGLIHLPVILLLTFAGVTAGLFLIPLNAALQAESHHGKLGKTIATQNFIDYIGMTGGSMVVLSAIRLGLTATGVFFSLAVVVVLLVTLLKIPKKA